VIPIILGIALAVLLFWVLLSGIRWLWFHPLWS
jgi:hypothetical protein